MEEPRGYYFFVDWDKIKTFEDLKNIIQALELRFLKGTAQYELVKKYLDFQKEDE
jgi:hypothetical protein